MVASSTGDAASEGVPPPESDGILSIATDAEDIIGAVVIHQDGDVAQEKTVVSTMMV